MSATAESPATPAKETHSFQAEVNELLNLVVNSLYSNREIFLRELVSNASDACDKARFRALTEHDLLGDNKDLEIQITTSSEASTITIEDTGIGMSHDELIENLGTIAHSGSKAFLKEYNKAKSDDVKLIGQFGVGFYSAFLVADRVDVVSRAAGSDEAWKWTSDAAGAFEMEPAVRDARGTTITLFLKEEHKEFASEWRLRSLISRYSDYVNHPVKLWTTKTTGEGDDQKEESTFETINQGTPLWQRSKSEINDEQAAELYKHQSHDWEPPLAWTHFKIEGNFLFTGMLFIPKNPPFDLYMPKQHGGLRLYVKRVFVMEDCEELLPTWLRFIRGIVDSDDLPLNVSRELLQDSAIVRTIRKQVIKKSLDLLEDLAKNRPQDYTTLWSTFGAVIKEGLHGEYEHGDRIRELLRFESTTTEAGKTTTLADYVARMPESQNAIYYALGSSRQALENSPHLEALKARDFEVLYMTDTVDEWVAESLGTYKEKKFVSVTRGDLGLDAKDSEDAEKADDATDTEGAKAEPENEELDPLVSYVKEALTDRLQDVKLSKRLTDSPVCLVVPEGGMHAHMERLLRAHGRDVPANKRVLEINPAHSLIKGLANMHNTETDHTNLNEWIELLYDQALITEGSPVADPGAFAKRMTRLLEKGLAPAPDA